MSADSGSVHLPGPASRARAAGAPPARRITGTLRLAPLLAVLLAAACSSTPEPTAQLAASRAAFESAQAAGARDLAAAELEAARQKLDLAQQAAQQDEPELARRLAEAAEVDARLAQARANAVRADAAAGQVEQGLRTLQNELQRGAR